jgi:SCY1-like protein 1
MDYLRTLGSAAVSTLVQKSGLNLPFTLGAKIVSLGNVWNLYDATKRVRAMAKLENDILKQFY